MSRVRRAAVATMLCAALTFVGAGVAGGSTHSEKSGAATNRAAKASSKGDPAVTRRLALAAGLQVAKKSHKRPTVTVRGKRYAAPNPYLAHLRLAAASTTRTGAGSRPTRASGGRRRRRPGAGRQPAHAVHPQRGRSRRGRSARTTPRASAEQLTKLGVDKQFQAANVHGRLSPPTVPPPSTALARTRAPSPRRPAPASATPATASRSPARSVTGRTVAPATATVTSTSSGCTLKAGSSISATTSGSSFDTVLVVYDSAGSHRRRRTTTPTTTRSRARSPTAREVRRTTT